VTLEEPGPLLVLEAEPDPETLELLGVEGAIIIDDEVILVIDEDRVVKVCPG
jgi:hypothetical protein